MRMPWSGAGSEWGMGTHVESGVDAIGWLMSQTWTTSGRESIFADVGSGSADFTLICGAGVAHLRRKCAIIFRRGSKALLLYHLSRVSHIHWSPAEAR